MRDAATANALLRSVLHACCLLGACSARPEPPSRVPSDPKHAAEQDTAEKEPAAPAFVDDFERETGSWRSGQRDRIHWNARIPEALDGHAAGLVFPGDPALSADDKVGVVHATSIETIRTFHYGSFRVRVAPARCESDEELVNGIFTYFNDGSDANGNGIADNSEIDIEILCSKPSVLWLTAWTDFEQVDGGSPNMRKRTRAVDLKTGDYRETAPGEEGKYGASLRGRLTSAIEADFPKAGAFYEMGFDWSRQAVRWFIVIDGREITLWKLNDASFVPNGAARFLLNVWHPDSQWWQGGKGAYPKRDAVLSVDWVRIWQNR